MAEKSFTVPGSVSADNTPALYTTTVSSNFGTIIDTYRADQYRSAQYDIQIKQNGGILREIVTVVNDQTAGGPSRTSNRYAQIRLPRNSQTVENSSPSTWVSSTFPTSGQYKHVAYGNGIWLAVGSNGIISRSTDAVTWSDVTSNFGTTIVNSVAYGDGLWTAVGGSGQLRTSTNGISWVTRTSNFGTTTINDVSYGIRVASSTTKKWVIVGDSGQIRASTDGITWTTQSSNAGTSNLRAVSFDNLQNFYAVGDMGVVRSNQINSTFWATVNTGIPSQLLDVAANSANVVVVGGGGFMAYGNTGSSPWRVINLPFTDNLNSVELGNGNFFVVGDSESAISLSSTDYLSWTTTSLGSGINNNNSAAYNDGKWVVVRDGQTFTYANLPTETKNISANLYTGNTVDSVTLYAQISDALTHNAEVTILSVKLEA